MPWSTQLVPTQGGQYVWQQEKETPFLVLQRFTPEQNLIGGILMTVRKAFRPADVPPYRLITKRSPNYSIAYGNTATEVDQFLQWVDMWLLPRLPSVRMPSQGSVEVFLADFLSNWARLRGENSLIPLTEDDFRMVIGNRYPLNAPAQPLQDPIVFALSKRQERTGQHSNPLTFSKIDESSMSGAELDSYRSYQSCLGPAGAPPALVPLINSAPLNHSHIDAIPQYNGGPHNRPPNGAMPPIASGPGRPPSGGYPGNMAYPPSLSSSNLSNSSMNNRSSYPPRYPGPALPANSPAFVQSGVPNVSAYAAPPPPKPSESPIQNDWIDLLEDEGKPGQKAPAHSTVDVNIGVAPPAAPLFPAVPNGPEYAVDKQVENLSLQPSAPAVESKSAASSTTTAGDDDEDKNVCKICFERDINTVILDCAHSVVCDLCGQNPKLKTAQSVANRFAKCSKSTNVSSWSFCVMCIKMNMLY
eukprot:TRINITY_DN3500_c0_g1_i1.p1 TRINITY_DN3500_c0_g1~~TRINITY_DN3500_c0_g1_i1.p1  ORF type:complete len:472 (-),score=50.57 TRINITY_DN3500_c0_g1_i1:10-1425(-)